MFNKIDKVLKKQLNKSNLNNAAQAAHICYVANQVLHDSHTSSEVRSLNTSEVKEVVRESCLESKYQAISFKNEVLTVGSKNSIDALKLQMNSEQIIDQINNKLGKKLVDRIKYQVLN